MFYMKRKKNRLSMRGFLGRRKNMSRVNNVRCDRPSLYEASNGEHVEHLQHALVDLVELYPTLPVLEIDGRFGVNTKQAVIEFQRMAGLHPTGVVDMVTWDRINKMHGKCKNTYKRVVEDETLNQSSNIVHEGSTGKYVLQLQKYLNQVSNTYTSIPKLKEDGNFGPKTKFSVLEFQRLFSLKQDAIVGDDTWKVLYEMATGEKIENIDI